MSVFDENAGIDDVKIVEEAIRIKYKEADAFRFSILSTQFDKNTKTYWKVLRELPQSYSNLEEAYGLHTEKINRMLEEMETMLKNYNSLYREWRIMHDFIENVLKGDLPKPSQELLYIIGGDFREKYTTKC